MRRIRVPFVVLWAVAALPALLLGALAASGSRLGCGSAGRHVPQPRAARRLLRPRRHPRRARLLHGRVELQCRPRPAHPALDGPRELAADRSRACRAWFLRRCSRRRSTGRVRGRRRCATTTAGSGSTIPEPDLGIFVVTAVNPAGPWSDPVLVKAARGAIDPCPFWDEDGQAYLVHAWARSRAGFANVLTLNRLAPDGRSVTDEGRIIINGEQHSRLPHARGAEALQTRRHLLDLRAGRRREERLAVGVPVRDRSTVRTSIASSWTRAERTSTARTRAPGSTRRPANTGSCTSRIMDAYGRVVHLQPMTWRDDGWPVIGTDPDGDGRGEPVRSWRKPAVGGSHAVTAPPTSDEFGAATPRPAVAVAGEPARRVAVAHREARNAPAVLAAAAGCRQPVSGASPAAAEVAGSGVRRHGGAGVHAGGGQQRRRGGTRRVRTGLRVGRAAPDAAGNTARDARSRERPGRAAPNARPPPSRPPRSRLYLRVTVTPGGEVPFQLQRGQHHASHRSARSFLPGRVCGSARRSGCSPQRRRVQQRRATPTGTGSASRGCRPDRLGVHPQPT